MTKKYQFKHIFLILPAIVAVIGVVAARQPGPVAAEGTRGVETAVTLQETPTDEAEYPDPFDAAAQTIGITVDVLWEALDNGQTIAGVAQANGVDAQSVIDAMVAAENSLIDQLLAADQIDAAEAEEWRSEVVATITEWVTIGLDDEFFEEDFVDPFIMAAETIGVDEDALWDALDNGKTIADLAQENNVEPQAVMDAIVAAESQLIDELLAEGEISAEEAEEWRTELVDYAVEFVNNGLEFFEDEFYGEDYLDPFVTAAEMLGVDEDAMWDALDNGKTIADLAQENNVDPQTIIDALVAAEAEFIDELLADGEISAGEADEWRVEAADYAAEFVNEGWDFEEFDGVELYLPDECVIEADGASLTDLEIPEACVEDGFAVFGATAVSD
ncbi:MAG: hypothetical protein ACE5EY_10550 [Anaerolineae bacterium]